MEVTAEQIEVLQEVYGYQDGELSTRQTQGRDKKTFASSINKGMIGELIAYIFFKSIYGEENTYWVEKSVNRNEEDLILFPNDEEHIKRLDIKYQDYGEHIAIHERVLLQEEKLIFIMKTYKGWDIYTLKIPVNELFTLRNPQLNEDGSEFVTWMPSNNPEVFNFIGSITGTYNKNSGLFLEAINTCVADK